MFEIIVIDNNSKDNSASMIRNKYPKAKLISNPSNFGYTRATNQAIQMGQSRYVLLLNPDTVVLPGALSSMISYMDQHPEVGILSPKLLNSNGTLQQQCRRGFPTLWNTFCYFTKLTKLFPNNPRFSGYLLTYLSKDHIHEVYAVSGSCLICRRKVIADIGLLDEDFFLYGSDLDWCIRVRNGGWKVVYYPKAEVIHYGGKGGTLANLPLAIHEFYEAMWLFYEKHYAKRHLPLIRILVRLSIIIKRCQTKTLNLVRRLKAAGSIKP